MLGYKELPKAAIPAALAKAERYRLLNEPEEAESICHDILTTEPTNESALVMLVLALTDQFPRRKLQAAQEVLPRLQTEYDRAYYAGLICERWAKAQLGAVPGNVTYHSLRDALRHYDHAQTLAAADNPDPILRWNTCVRLIEARSELAPKDSDEPGGEGYGWDEPPKPTR
jgi:hypothetical protein